MPTTVPQTAVWRRLVTVILLLMAAWLFWRALLAVPPGLEMDELIEAQIAAQVQAGDWRLFYPAGQGREGLYYYWLALWTAVSGTHLFTIRLASTMVSLLGLATIYRLVRLLFGVSLGWLAAAFFPLTFWTLFAARSGLRSSALPLVAALAALFFLRGLRDGRSKGSAWATAVFILAGFLAGLSLYLYTAARILPFIFLLFVTYLWLWHRPIVAGQGWRLLLAGAVMLLTMFPLVSFLRNNPEADEFAFLDFNRPLAALQAGDPQPAFETTWATLRMFSGPGDPLMFDNVPGRPVFVAVVAAFFFGGLLVALWRWRQWPYAFVVIWLFVSLLPGMLSQPAPNFYRTVLAQVVVFVFPVLPLGLVWEYGRSHPQKFAKAKVVAGLGALLLLGWQGHATWLAYFEQWPQVEGIRFFWQTGLAEAAAVVQTTDTPEDIALCTVLTYEQDPWWRPAYQSWTYLTRDDGETAVRFYDCRQSVVLPAAETALFLYPEVGDPLELIPEPLRGMWLTDAASFAEPLTANETSAMVVAPALAKDDGWETAVFLAPEAGGDAANRSTQFGGSFQMIGYQLSPRPARPGQPLQLVTAWEVIGPPPPQLSLFIHLLSDPQTVAAQQDGLPLSSHTLEPGDRFWLLHNQIFVPPEMPAGEFNLALGFYLSRTFERLPVVHDSEPHGDRLFIPITIGH